MTDTDVQDIIADICNSVGVEPDIDESGVSCSLEITTKEGRKYLVEMYSFFENSLKIDIDDNPYEVKKGLNNSIQISNITNCDKKSDTFVCKTEDNSAIEITPHKHYFSIFVKSSSESKLTNTLEIYNIDKYERW